MEQIYTIPVNEAFEKCAESPDFTCPFCSLRNTLQTNEVQLILGASMMEPDIRKKTNEQGFCADHWKTLASAGKRLPLALIIQSHLAEVEKKIKKPGLAPAISGADSAKTIKKMTDDCYICRRIEFNFQHMMETAVLLWDSDGDFSVKLAAQSGFCLPHYARFLSTAKGMLKAKSFARLYKAAFDVESRYADGVQKKIDSFARRFDYRYADNAKNGDETAIEDALAALCGDKI